MNPIKTTALACLFIPCIIFSGCAGQTPIDTNLSSAEDTRQTIVNSSEPTNSNELASTSSVETASTEPSLSSDDRNHIIDLSTTLYTYDQMIVDLGKFQTYYPDLIHYSIIGTTADGREIPMVVFGNADATSQIFICAATHAREYMTTQLVMKQLEYYCANYSTGTYDGHSFQDLFQQTAIYLVPMVNPDGVSISQLGEAGLRNTSLRSALSSIYAQDVANGYTTEDYVTYLTRWKANGRGVDLNRNYSPGWESVTDRTAPSSTTYKGTVPGSEAESSALMNVLSNMTHLKMAISYHSYGSLVYYQYGQSEPLWSGNETLATHISNLTGYYLAGYSNEAGMSNWCVNVLGVPSVTVETGSVPCPLPLDQFNELWASNQNMWAMLASLPK